MDVSTKGAITTSLLLCFLAVVYASPTPTPWTDCSATCGGGTKSRDLTDGTIETVACNVQACTSFTAWKFQSCDDYSCTGRTTVVETRECPPRNACYGPMLRLLFEEECPTCATTVAATTSIDTTLLIDTTILNTAEDTLV